MVVPMPRVGEKRILTVLLSFRGKSGWVVICGLVTATVVPFTQLFSAGRNILYGTGVCDTLGSDVDDRKLLVKHSVGEGKKL
jgi:hypothetical protein